MYENPLRLAGALVISSGLSIGAEAIACAPNDSVYIGAICATASNFCPQGYLAADGRTLAISQYPALFSLVGTFYGGNGTSNFALPDLRGRVPVGVGTGTGLSPVNIGQQRGSETTTLQQANLPASGALSISVAVGTAPGSATSPAGGNTQLGASAAAGPQTATIWSAPGGATVALSGVTASGGLSGGAGTAFTNLPPELGVTYCIAVEGIFPARP